jgi:glycosyltransferase involved in cell wall biosynthesis
MLPTLSIIIPSYNRAAIISKTIDSFIAQDYKNWEMLVVDDHSTDNTKDVIELYHQKDPRIHYLLNERKKGAQGARNTGILHAKYDWVVLFDSDDIVYPNFLRRMVDEIDDNTDVVTCYARRVWIDGSKTTIEEWGGDGDIERLLLKGITYVNFDDCLFRKLKLLKIGLLDEDCPCMQEWDTHIRLSKSCTYKQIKEPLMDYMWGGDDTISKSKKNKHGCVYVMWHNRKRWKELEYEAFFTLARSLFFDVDVRRKLTLMMICPQLILRLPRMCIGRMLKKLKQ